jgi:hypothetical protein
VLLAKVSDRSLIAPTARADSALGELAHAIEMALHTFIVFALEDIEREGKSWSANTVKNKKKSSHKKSQHKVDDDEEKDDMKDNSRDVNTAQPQNKSDKADG